MKTKVGVLLINLGTAEAPTPTAVRRFLRAFLADKRVVEIPRLLWLPVLYLFVLPFRPVKVAAAYREIWTREGSPLMAVLKRQALAVATAVSAQCDTVDIRVAYALSYGKPSIADVLSKFRADGRERIVVFPLFPQYSATSTGPVYDQLAKVQMGSRDVADLRIIKDYHDAPGYIEALASSVEKHWSEHPRAEKLLMSFHGIPRRNVELGDPYLRQCQTTAGLLAEKLQLNDQQWGIAFQSRLGPSQWLQPYTDEILVQWAQQGVKSVEIISPAFSADCLETLEEIAIRYRDVFLSGGGEKYHFIPCLNDSSTHINFLVQRIRLELQAFNVPG